MIIGPDGATEASLSSATGGWATAWIDPSRAREIRRATRTDKIPVAELFPGAPGATAADELLGGEAGPALSRSYND